MTQLPAADYPTYFVAPEPEGALSALKDAVAALTCRVTQDDLDRIDNLLAYVEMEITYGPAITQGRPWAA